MKIGIFVSFGITENPDEKVELYDISIYSEDVAVIKLTDNIIDDQKKVLLQLGYLNHYKNSYGEKLESVVEDMLRGSIDSEKLYYNDYHGKHVSVLKFIEKEVDHNEW